MKFLFDSHNLIYIQRTYVRLHIYELIKAPYLIKCIYVVRSAGNPAPYIYIPDIYVDVVKLNIYYYYVSGIQIQYIYSISFPSFFGCVVFVCTYLRQMQLNKFCEFIDYIYMLFNWQLHSSSAFFFFIKNFKNKIKEFHASSSLFLFMASKLANFLFI